MAKVQGKPVFDEERCKGCELCTMVCPVNIVQMSKKINSKGYQPATVTDASKCIACMRCAQMCPDVAIEIYREKI